MKKGMALVVSIALMLSMVLTSSFAMAEETTNEITVAVSSQISTLDAALNSSTHCSQILTSVEVSMFRTLSDGTQENDLCESYEVAPDGMTYTFKVKEGILWSDGVALTAKDFEYGIKRAIGYGPDNAYTAQNLVNYIKGAQEASDAMMDVADMTEVGVTATDDYTLVIELSNPCPYFLKLLSGGTFSAMRADFAKEHDSSWSVEGGFPSAGPFMVESVNTNEGAVLVKNPNYYDAENVKLDKINFVVMTDENAQLSAFKTGEIDLALSVPAELATSDEYTDYFFKLDAYTCPYFVFLNSGSSTPNPALQDVRVRKALALSVDKDMLIEMLNGGIYITKLNGYVPFGFEGLNGDFRAEKNDYLMYDLEQAKALLAEAGYTDANPLKIEYLYSNSQFHADVAQLLQQFWAMAGIQVELKSVEGGVFYDFVDNGDFQMSRYAIASSTDPMTYFHSFMTTSQIVPAVEDAKLDEMCNTAAAMVDKTEYLTYLHDIETYMLDEQCYLIPLFTQESVKLLQTKVKGAWATPGGIFNFKDTYIEG